MTERPEHADLLIIGGGIAGLCAALRAPASARVVVVDKGEAGAGSSPLAQGGMAAAVGANDAPELHAQDTIAAGAGLCDAAVVADICGRGPAAVDWLISLGCDFDRTPDGSLHLAREGGQQVGRSVHWRDATGAEIVRALRRAVAERNVERVRATATALVLDDGSCVGADTDAGRFTAGTTLIATGGAGALWGSTTNAPGAAADGLVLGSSAGATLADLEFMQFHPTVLAAGTGQRVLLTEALRGDGALLVDARGERFVDELAPRHVVTKAILDTGAAFLDLRGIDGLDERFPTVVAGARAYGFDPRDQLLPVRPAAHYFIGGIATDAHGRTEVPGLFAAGECASTGMHGANRLAGNSLLETVVVGGRVGAQVTRAAASGPSAGDAARGGAASIAGPVLAAIAEVMWRDAGPIREAAGLARAADALRALGGGGHAALCRRIVEAARARSETRGVHVRADHPGADPAQAARAFDRAPTAVRD